MGALVGLQVVTPGECLAAVEAEVRLDLVVDGSDVAAEVVAARELTAADLAAMLEIFVVHVLYVLCEAAL